MTKVFELTSLINAALLEDMPYGDITSELMINRNSISEATLISKESGIFYGVCIIEETVKQVDPNIRYHIEVNDGAFLTKGSNIANFKGSSISILKIERVILNFLQRLSGIATTTHAFVTELNDPTISVLDTRKTTPLFRALEKQAVLAGGGKNHRHNLSDMVLIKENHLSAFFLNHTPSELANLFDQFKNNNKDIKIEIEVETLDQLDTYDLSKVDYIMFDNFTLDQIQKGVEICKSKHYSAEIEISGNVSLETISQYKGLDIDRISVGSITHSVKALDLSLLFK